VLQREQTDGDQVAPVGCNGTILSAVSQSSDQGWTYRVDFGESVFQIRQQDLKLAG
jgi:hypothetical protein